MKTFKQFLLFIIFVNFLSCNSQMDNGNDEIIDEKHDIPECGKNEINESEFLLMKIFPEKVSINSTNTWIVENRTKHDIYLGSVFSLEYYELNNWNIIPLNWEWEAIGYIIFPDEVYTGETIIGQWTLYSLINEFNQGKKGRYRIIKNYTIADFGNYELCTEFEII